MEELNAIDELNETTQICRICLNTERELHSIFSFGQVCDKSVQLVDVVTECTSIEFNKNDHLPAFVCQQCLVQVCKIYKFREMAFRSNLLLRQKLRPPKKPHKPKILKTYAIENRQKFREKTLADKMVPLKKERNLNICNSNEIDDNELEYLTVIVTNEESTESGDETIECLIEQDQQNSDEYFIDDSADDEIPKVSLANYRRRTKNDDPNRSLTCPECNKTLSNFSSYKYHMQLHSDHTPFLCPDCGQGFKTRNAYDGHMITHLGESNPNKCNVCNKSYRQAASLRSHMLTHTGEKPFKCDICGKGMTQKSGFKKHMLTHTGEKPHVCDICNKSFRYSSNLIMHKRSHIGEKNFDCTECGKKFLSKEQLKRHSTIHSGLKPYQCPTCKKCFNRRSTLNIHQKVHANSTKYSCKQCSESFDKKLYLMNHEKTHTTLAAPSKN